MMASSVRALKYVKTAPRRPPQKPASKPTSVSRVRSGPRFGLPSWPGVKPERPPSAAIGFQVRVASKAPGALPASPTAARNLKVSMRLDGQNDSSESTYDMLSFG